MSKFSVTAQELLMVFLVVIVSFAVTRIGPLTIWSQGCFVVVAGILIIMTAFILKNNAKEE